MLRPFRKAWPRSRRRISGPRVVWPADPPREPGQLPPETDACSTESTKPERSSHLAGFDPEDRALIEALLA